MKAFNPIDTDKFVTHAITIELETQEEVCAFYTVFNHTAITAFLHKYGLDPKRIRCVINTDLNETDKYHTELHGVLTSVGKEGDK